MKTEAAILVSTTKPLEIVDIEIPKLKQGQVLIELYFSGICGTQLMEIDGKKHLGADSVSINQTPNFSYSYFQ